VRTEYVFSHSQYIRYGTVRYGRKVSSLGMMYDYLIPDTVGTVHVAYSLAFVATRMPLSLEKTGLPHMMRMRENRYVGCKVLYALVYMLFVPVHSPLARSPFSVYRPCAVRTYSNPSLLTTGTGTPYQYSYSVVSTYRAVERQTGPRRCGERRSKIIRSNKYSVYLSPRRPSSHLHHRTYGVR
jgi:hypothetical protein